MQSQSNCLGGNVVLDSFIMDGDGILDQKYQKQMFSDFYYEDLKKGTHKIGF